VIINSKKDGFSSKAIIVSMRFALMNKVLVLVLILISASGFGGNDVMHQSNSGTKKKTFQHGEELVYTLYYGFIHGGNGSITLCDTQYNDKRVYHAKVVAKSVGITDMIYKIEDIYESYFDTLTCLPYKSVRNISEGGYRDYDEVYFAQKDSSIFSKKGGTIKVPSDILDIVSSLFSLRSMDLDTLQKGDVLRFITFFGDEIFPFNLRYRGKEVIKTKLGKYECHRFDPVVEVGRVFETKDDMTFWITADHNLIPLRVRMKIIIGSLYCDLVSYKNLANNFQPIK
jgi:hypothetical protein